MRLLNTKLKTIKELEAEKSLIEERIKQERGELFSILEKENLKQYKNPEIATVSYATKKIVTYKDKVSTLEYLKQNNLVKYYETIPAQEVISKNLDEDIKAGTFMVAGAEIKETSSPMIRFNK
jgi:hypothetical protein